MTAGHVLNLTRRERDILVAWNDGTFQTSIQPADKLEAVFAEVNARAAREAHERADRARFPDVADFWRRVAMRIDCALKVQEQPHRIAAE